LAQANRTRRERTCKFRCPEKMQDNGKLSTIWTLWNIA